MHKRDVTRALIDKKVDSANNFEWLAQMRLYFQPDNPNALEQLKIRMANAEFHYGFEYLGTELPLQSRTFSLALPRYTRPARSIGSNASDRPMFPHHDSSTARQIRWLTIRTSR